MQSYVTVETSAGAVRHNLRLLRESIAPGVKLCLPVKSDCYGHGLSLLLDVVAPLVDCLAVAAPEEAIEVRRLGCKLPLLCFFSAAAYLDGRERDDALREMIANDVMQTVVSRDEVEPIARAARHLGRRAKIHVKVDSGMGRSGIPARETAELADLIRREDALALCGVFSHFAASDQADKTFTHRQLACFQQAVAPFRTFPVPRTPPAPRTAAVPAAFTTSPVPAAQNTQDSNLTTNSFTPPNNFTVHIANSVATIDLPAAHFDMVRPGLAAYGYQPSQHLKNHLPLRPALRAVARLMPVKEIAAGDSCGYGLTYTFTRPSRIGRIAIGYGDGYLRCLSNKSTVRIHGVDVPLRGRVSMDQIIVDVTDVPQARLGDEVELISPDPAAPHSVENLARLAGTIPYEITCLLGGRIRRVLVD